MFDLLENSLSKIIPRKKIRSLSDEYFKAENTPRDNLYKLFVDDEVNFSWKQLICQ